MTMTRALSIALALTTIACQTQPPAPTPTPATAVAADAAPAAVAPVLAPPTSAPIAAPDAATAAAPALGVEKKAGAACTQVPRELPLEQRCAMAGAKVNRFSNACVGKCSAIEQQKMCAQVLTQGCQCPQGQCIDDKSGCCRPLKR